MIRPYVPDRTSGYFRKSSALHTFRTPYAHKKRCREAIRQPAETMQLSYPMRFRTFAILDPRNSSGLRLFAYGHSLP